MSSQEDLTETLRVELLAGLSPLGWSVVEPSRPELLFVLERTLDSGLDATMWLGKPQAVWGPVVFVHGIEVGVGYGRLRELAYLTASYGAAVQRSSLFADGVLELDLYDEDEGYEDYEDAPPDFEFRAHTPEEARAVARQLVEVVTEHGCRIANRYADVDELIAAVPGVRAASWLAATGRLDEAAAVLDGLSGRPRLAFTGACYPERSLEPGFGGIDLSILRARQPTRI